MSTAKRKLAAIVFADIAGYTDKASQDESAALSVRDRVEKLVKSSSLSHNGRIVKMMGDGAMLEFASAVEAVSCALDIQDQMEHLNTELGLPEPIALRIGAHVGDVVEEDNDLYGNAVNIASRVHGMARPGGICITREVYVQIRPILKLQCLPVQGSASDRMPEKVEVFTVIGEEAAPQPTVRKLRLGWLAAAGVLFAGILAYPMVFGGKAGVSDAGSVIAANDNAHRLLLPDWVTPGEWFSLDTGQESPNLAVYFGNRKATSRFDGGKLMVQTPDDLPTEQTTIAVFEGDSSNPLMRQQTQVIRYGALAMHTKSDPSESIGQSGPEVEIDSNKAEPPKPPSTRIVEEPNKNSSGTSQPAKAKTPPTRPPAQAPKGSGSGMSSEELEKSMDYNAIVNTIGVGAPGATHFRFKDLDKLPAAIGGAMRAMNLAQVGKPEDARKAIQGVRVSLKDTDPGIAIETEALLKTAEALIVDGSHPAASGIPRARPKFAEAFAFSVNRGTRNLPGLMFVEQQIRDNKPEEARRTLEMLKSFPDLTQSEKKALVRLETRVKKMDSSKAGARTSTEAPKPS